MQEINEKYFEGERALYGLSNAILENVTFGEGEWPLKETQNLEIRANIFKYKYPLWYSDNIKVTDSTFETMSRSGIWYTNNISIKNSNLQAPKLFRRCKHVSLDHVFFSDAEETMWTCENVTLINCQIDGEYLSWNSSNIIFRDCTIESDQGLCYMDHVTLENCILNQTTLAFEKCSNINATIKSKITSVKNPISGVIKAKKTETLIIDPAKVDPRDTKIISEEAIDKKVLVSDQNQDGEYN